MKIAWPATAGAHRELPARRGLAASREGRDLLVPHMHPVDPAKPAEAVVETIETIAGDGPNALHTGICEGDGTLVRDRSVGHWLILSTAAVMEHAFHLAVIRTKKGPRYAGPS